MKLIPITAYIDEISKVYIPTENREKHIIEFHQRFYDQTIKYKNFLKQPLELGMFVPVVATGNVLEEPFYDPANEQYWSAERFGYDTAKEKVLFEGFALLEAEWHAGTSAVQNEALGITIYLHSGTISIQQPNGIGYGIVKMIEDLCQFNFDLSSSASKKINI